MPTLLTVNAKGTWDNTHRFLRDVSVKVCEIRAEAVAEDTTEPRGTVIEPTGDSEPGQWEFSILDDYVDVPLTLIATVPSPLPRDAGDDESASEPALCVVEQLFRVTGEQPPIEFFDRDGRSHEGPSHPRITMPDPCVRSRCSSIVELTIDLRFINVSNRYNNRRGTHWGQQGVQSCDVHFYQYTGKERETTTGLPAVWVVAIPPAVSEVRIENVGVVLFFAPIRAQHERDVDDMRNEGQLRRYLDQRYPDTPYVVRRDGREVLFPHPDCCYCGQIADTDPTGELAASNKRVILVLPQNSTGEDVNENDELDPGEDLDGDDEIDPRQGPRFGDAVRSRHIDELVGSLVSALAGDCKISDTYPDRVSCSRLAVAGFSFGGEQAIRCWDRNKRRIDELYLFDPNFDPDYDLDDLQETERLEAERRALEAENDSDEELDLPPIPSPGRGTFQWAVRDLASWKSDHKLRLVGGMHLRKMRTFADHYLEVSAPSHPTNLSTEQGDCTLWPYHDEFWQQSEIYRAVFAPYNAISRTDEVDRTDTVSRRAHVYLEADNPTPNDKHVRVVERPEGVPDGVRQLSQMSEPEVAYRFIWQDIVNHNNPERALDFEQTCDEMRGNVQGIRHQWCAYGGQGTDNSLATFKGYLWWCLQLSGFD